MDNDDQQVGMLLTRREMLKLLGALGAAMLVGCGPDLSLIHISEPTRPY